MPVPAIGIGASALAGGSTAGGIFTFKNVAAAVSAAASLASAASSMQQGRQQQQGADLQAELYRRQAARESEIGALKARRVREEGESLAATQRAILAAGGGEQSTGSALLIQEDLSEETEFNARLAEANAEQAAHAAASEAVLARLEGRNARTASFFRAGTALLSGASDVAKIGARFG
jgi:hypothetical protein